MLDMSEQSFLAAMIDKDIFAVEVFFKLHLQAIPSDAEVLLTTTVNKT
jgi:hypothetical protein